MTVANRQLQVVGVISENLMARTVTKVGVHSPLCCNVGAVSSLSAHCCRPASHQSPHTRRDLTEEDLLLERDHPSKMSRLASLTPSRSAQPSPSPSPAPSRSSRSSTPTPAAPVVALAKSRYEETTYHRMIKLLIGEFRILLKTWDEVVLVDGLKAGKGCIDEATEME